MTHYTVSFLIRLWRKPITRIITSLMILVILLFILPLADLWNAVKQVSPSLWIFIVIAFILGHGVGAAKWNLLISGEKTTLPFLVASRFHFAGLFSNLFLPSIAGGDVVRAGMTIQFKTEAKEAIILGSLLDRFLDMVALILLILIGAVLSPTILVFKDQTMLIGTSLLLLLGVVLGGVVLLIVPPPKFLPQRLTTVINRIRNILKHLIKNPRRALTALSLAILIQGMFVSLNAALGAAIGIRLPLPIWFLVWPLAKLSATLPISMGGLGVREAALAVFLGRFGISIASSVGLGLLWQTVLIAGGLVGGVFYFFSSRTVPSRKEFMAVAVRHKEKARS